MAKSKMSGPEVGSTCIKICRCCKQDTVHAWKQLGKTWYAWVCTDCSSIWDLETLVTTLAKTVWGNKK